MNSKWLCFVARLNFISRAGVKNVSNEHFFLLNFV